MTDVVFPAVVYFRIWKGSTEIFSWGFVSCFLQHSFPFFWAVRWSWRPAAADSSLHCSDEAVCEVSEGSVPQRNSDCPACRLLSDADCCLYGRAKLASLIRWRNVLCLLIFRSKMLFGKYKVHKAWTLYEAVLILLKNRISTDEFHKRIIHPECENFHTFICFQTKFWEMWVFFVNKVEVNGH